MQNNPQEAISQALNIWQSVSPAERENHIKNLYKSQNANYEQKKAEVLEAMRKNDPRINYIMGMFQKAGLR